jgi:ubiquinone/menaquinone biosynthesis C-methylase UbiE
MLYDTVGPSIERQHSALMAKAREVSGNAGGSVRCDPSLRIPSYHAAVDIHSKPGGYHNEFSGDDIFAGAEYDRTVNVYLMGMLGPNNDGIARSLIRWIKDEHPGFEPRAILDMGCTVGHSTLAYCDAWPNATIHAIDIGGPCVRYAHARAEGMGKRVHFSQQNAEHTDFPDGSFDLVVSHIMMHETSTKALANIFAESRRLLRPGGIMMHADGIAEKADPFDKYMAEWMAHYNNEPFLGTLQDLDLPNMARDAGFSHNRVFETRIPSVGAAERGANGKSANGKGKAPGYAWYTIAATK